MENTPITSVADGAHNEIRRITVYPSPTRSDRSQVAIESATARAVRLTIVDIAGCTVYSSDQQHQLVSGLNILPLNTHGLASGLYFVRIESKEESTTVAFSVAR